MMNVPDRLFAVGGAGKELAFEFLETDWVLHEALTPQRSPEELRVTIIDTAEEEENEDRERIAGIERRIDEVREALRTESGTDKRTGRITVEYKILTEHLQLAHSLDLTGEAQVARITAGNGISPADWWLSRKHIPENLDFAKGVVRKRALGKALYYKAYAEDESVSNIIDLPEKGEVAVVTGLGGGTGSGILLDLVRHLKNEQRTANVTLFGILPNNLEGPEENANAYALLSELEYLSVNPDEGGQDLFRDIVLLPIEPTDYEGKRGDEEKIREFDRAFVYTLATYYNTQGKENLFETPPHAPFTMAIPLVLRYNIEAIEEARNVVHDLFETRRRMLDAEETVYVAVENFLDRQGLTAEAKLSEEDRVDLERRVEAIETLLALDLFHELAYQSLSVFRSEVQEAVAESNAERIEEQIDVMADVVEANVMNQINSFVDDLDAQLAVVLERDVLALGTRKDLLRRQKAITDPRVRDMVGFLLGVKGGSAGIKYGQLKSRYEEVRDERATTESELTALVAAAEQAQAEQAEAIERKTTEWFQTVRPQLDQLRTLATLSVDSNLRTLESELKTYNTNVERAESREVLAAMSTGPLAETLEALDQELAVVDLTVDRHRILGAADKLRDARLASFEKNQGGRFTFLKRDTRERATKQLRMLAAQLDESGVFSASELNGEFISEVTYRDDISEQVDTRRAELVAPIEEQLALRLDDPEMLDWTALRTTLAQRPDDETLREFARQTYRAEVADSGDADGRRASLESDLATLTDTVETYEATLGLYDESNRPQAEWTQYSDAYDEQLKTFTDEQTRSVATKPDDYRYMRSVQPYDVFRATGKSHLAASDIFHDPHEVDRLEEYLFELVEKAREQAYCGLRRRKLVADQRRYTHMKVRVGIASRLNLREMISVDLSAKFSDAFELSKVEKDSPYTQWERPFGGPWDVGMTVFVVGAFFDNLRTVALPHGYGEGYNRLERTLGPDIYIHHAYGLDQGFYVHRARQFNVESESDVAAFLQDEPSLAQTLLAAHDVNTVPRESDAESSSTDTTRPDATPPEPDPEPSTPTGASVPLENDSERQLGEG